MTRFVNINQIGGHSGPNIFLCCCSFSFVIQQLFRTKPKINIVRRSFLLHLPSISIVVWLCLVLSSVSVDSLLHNVGDVVQVTKSSFSTCALHTHTFARAHCLIHCFGLWMGQFIYCRMAGTTQTHNVCVKARVCVCSLVWTLWSSHSSTATRTNAHINSTLNATYAFVTLFSFSILQWHTLPPTYYPIFDSTKFFSSFLSFFRSLPPSRECENCSTY